MFKQPPYFYSNHYCNNRDGESLSTSNIMNYGRAIRLVRSTRGISQKALAKKLDVDPSLISHLEKNTRQPSAETLSQLSTALGLPLYLFVFLASDKEDMQGLPPEQAQLFGAELLRLLASESPERKLPGQ